MITKIIHTGDIHIRNLRRMDEYQEVFETFITKCKDIIEENGKDNTRIVIAGDLLHNKLDISGEGYLLASWFLRQLDKLCKTIVIAGNHDMNMANTSRLDPISTIFSMCKFENTYYLDMELNYESGCITDDNVVWCLYSSFDGFNKPNIEEYRAKLSNDANMRFVGLFHGDIRSAVTDTGYKTEHGLDASYFDGLDFCLMGHIHKRQEINYEGVRLVYCGSLIQQNHGENLSEHGFVVWDVENAKYGFAKIEDKNYGFYTLKINDIKDLEEDKETILNL